VTCTGRPQSYKFEQYADLFDFLELLKKKCDRNSTILANSARRSAPLGRENPVTWSGLAARCEAVKVQIKEVVLKSGPAAPRSSTHMDCRSISPGSGRSRRRIRKSAVAAASRWHEFLSRYVEICGAQPQIVDVNAPGSLRSIPRPGPPSCRSGGDGSRQAFSADLPGSHLKW